MSRPMMPAKTTKAPKAPIVAPRLAPPSGAAPSAAFAPAPSAITEFSTVSITTATTSSSTVTPIASCPARSWPWPVSCNTFPMIADDDTISIAAKKSVCVGSSPTTTPSPRVA